MGFVIYYSHCIYAEASLIIQERGGWDEEVLIGEQATMVSLGQQSYSGSVTFNTVKE